MVSNLVAKRRRFQVASSPLLAARGICYLHIMESTYSLSSVSQRPGSRATLMIAAFKLVLLILTNFVSPHDYQSFITDFFFFKLTSCSDRCGNLAV